MAYELAGTIFNIQKFSIHDGDGIRTPFSLSVVQQSGIPVRGYQGDGCKIQLYGLRQMRSAVRIRCGSGGKL